MTDIAIIQNLFDPTTGAQIYPVTTDEAVFATDDEGNHCTMKTYVKSKEEKLLEKISELEGRIAELERKSNIND